MPWQNSRHEESNEGEQDDQGLIIRAIVARAASRGIHERSKKWRVKVGFPRRQDSGCFIGGTGMQGTRSMEEDVSIETETLFQGTLRAPGLLGIYSGVENELYFF